MRIAIIQFILSVIIRYAGETIPRSRLYDVSAGDGPWLEIYRVLQDITYRFNALSRLTVAILFAVASHHVYTYRVVPKVDYAFCQKMMLYKYLK